MSGVPAIRSERVRPRTQEERSAATRERLIAATLDCIAELGYPEATTTVIAERAGLSRGALQHHFASRTDLIVTAIEAVAAELNLRFDAAGLASIPLDQRVAAIVDHYWKVFSSPMFRAALSIWLAVGADPVLGRRLRERVVRFRNDIGPWQTVFADVGHGDAELAALRRTVMAAVRGYAISRMFGVTELWRRDRPVLCRMVLSALRRDNSAECAGNRSQ